MSPDLLTHRDIPWELTAIERPETIEALTLTQTELLSHCADLKAETRALRALLSEALAFIAKQHDEIQRATKAIDHQREQLRTRRGADAA